MNNFLNPQFEKENLDRYIIRSAIMNSLHKSINCFDGNLLDVGCGKMPYRQYLLENSKIVHYTGLDIEVALEYDKQVKPDYVWDGTKMPLADHSYSTVLATEVLEHCPDPEIILKEIFRVLKPEGVFFFTVPFLWNLHEVPNDEYRYTPFALERLLRKAGFNEIKVKATGGWHASMAQMLGLWVRRSPMKNSKREFLSLLLKPIIKYLLRLDKPENVHFKEGQMITGLYGVVRK